MNDCFGIKPSVFANWTRISVPKRNPLSLNIFGEGHLHNGYLVAGRVRLTSFASATRNFLTRPTTDVLASRNEICRSSEHSPLVRGNLGLDAPYGHFTSRPQYSDLLLSGFAVFYPPHMCLISFHRPWLTGSLVGLGGTQTSIWGAWAKRQLLRLHHHAPFRVIQSSCASTHLFKGASLWFMPK